MGRRDGLRRRFEGAAVLEELLAAAGAQVDALGAAEALREAQHEGLSPGEVFPTLFEGEPKFSDPQLARRLYENLFGLWDALESGQPLEQAEKSGREKVQKPEAPGAWGDGGPDEEWVERAWRYLDADVRARERLWHSFENRQDALLGWLDAQDLSDEGYGVLRLLLSELSSMIELGTGAPLSGASEPPPVKTDEAPGAGQDEVPQALWAYAEEALFEAGQDDEAPLSPAELETVRRLARRGLLALHRARGA
jgi:hypothetical protein